MSPFSSKLPVPSHHAQNEIQMPSHGLKAWRLSTTDLTPGSASLAHITPAVQSFSLFLECPSLFLPQVRQEAVPSGLKALTRVSPTQQAAPLPEAQLSPTPPP